MSEKTPSVLNCRVSDVSHQSKRRMGPTLIRFEHAAVNSTNDVGNEVESALSKGFDAPEVEYTFKDGMPSVKVAMRAKKMKKGGGGMEYNNSVASVRREYRVGNCVWSFDNFGQKVKRLCAGRTERRRKSVHGLSFDI
jgi:hypothetical protein